MPIDPKQINTKSLFSVDKILLSRGYKVTKENDTSKLLLTEANMSAEIWETVYNVFLDKKSRKELKFFLDKQEQPTLDEVIKLVNHDKFIRESQRFANTFEWFVGELMINNFAAFSFSFGVSIKHIQRNSTGNDAGDFDTLVVLRDTNIACFECKTGGFDGDAILKCYERMLALNCQYTILFCVKDINEKQLENDSKRIKIPIGLCHSLNKIAIKGNEEDSIYAINNCYILDMSGNIENKIRTVLRVNFAKINSLHNTTFPSDGIYNMMGYDFKEISMTSYER